MFLGIGLSSCNLSNRNKIDIPEELGDTVPASEFAVIEDTATVQPVDTNYIQKKINR